MASNRAPDGWTPNTSINGTFADAYCPPCIHCGQPMRYMFWQQGVVKMHKGTDDFLCAEIPKENTANGA